MKRRTFIAGAGSAAIAVAGCLDRSDDGSDEENDDGGEGEQGYTEYEECPLYVIDVDDLPNRAWDEAVTAIEVGELETEGRVVLDEVLDFDETYLAYDDTYYALDIERDGDQATVKAGEELPETGPIHLESDIDSPYELTISVEYEGEEVLEEELTVEPDDTEFELDEDFRYGEYSARVQALGDTEEIEWTANEHSWHPRFIITEDGIEVLFEEADVSVCDWNDDGEVAY